MAPRRGAKDGAVAQSAPAKQTTPTPAKKRPRPSATAEVHVETQQPANAEAPGCPSDASPPSLKKLKTGNGVNDVAQQPANATADASPPSPTKLNTGNGATDVAKRPANAIAPASASNASPPSPKKLNTGNGAADVEGVAPKAAVRREWDQTAKLDASSKYLGVNRHKSTSRWQATYKGKYLGLYDTEEEAAETRYQYLKTIVGEEQVAAVPVTQLFAKVAHPPPVPFASAEAGAKKKQATLQAGKTKPAPEIAPDASTPTLLKASSSKAAVPTRFKEGGAAPMEPSTPPRATSKTAVSSKTPPPRGSWFPRSAQGTPDKMGAVLGGGSSKKSSFKAPSDSGFVEKTMASTT